MSLEKQKESIVKQKEAISKKKSAIQNKINKLNKLEEDLKNIKTLESYTVEEKCKRFDELYDLAKSMLNEKLEDGYENDDNPHWAHEAIIELLGEERKTPKQGQARNTIWDIWNNIEPMLRDE